MAKSDSRLAYEQFIDSIVEDSSALSSRLIRKEGIFTKAPNNERFNGFVSGLDNEQRQILADMLNKERMSAFHDLLANLSWWIECKDISLCHKNSRMPVDVSGMGLHGDYIGRLEDWEWPGLIN